MRGVAFPVCVSVNECVCHCSPLETDTNVSIFCATQFFQLCVVYDGCVVYDEMLYYG
jgi:hypothetical protein